MNNYHPSNPDDPTANEPESTQHDEANRGSLRQSAAEGGSPQQSAEERGNLQQPAEERSSVQQNAEASGKLQQSAAVVSEPDDRTEFHTLTTREIVRMFEDAGVPRSPRTISDWCDKTSRGDSKLDAYFDAADRKYYVTPESVGRAIKEEQMKAARTTDQSSPSDRGSGAERAEPSSRQSDPRATSTTADAGELEDMARKISRLERDVLIKDAMIDHYENSQKMLFDRIEKRSIEVGQLRSQILSLEAGDQDHPPTPDARIWEAEREIDFEIEPTGENDADAGSERVAA